MTGPDPLATGLGLSAEYFKSPYVLSTFSNVPVERMDEIETRINEVIEKEKREFDINRMRTLSKLKDNFSTK